VPEGSKVSRIRIVFEERFDRREEMDTLLSIVRLVSYNLRFRNNVAGFTGTSRRARSVRDVGPGKTGKQDLTEKTIGAIPSSR
jgi:hypothetical protein